MIGTTNPYIAPQASTSPVEAFLRWDGQIGEGGDWVARIAYIALWVGINLAMVYMWTLPGPRCVDAIYSAVMLYVDVAGIRYKTWRR